MTKIGIIVESPAKCKKIESLLPNTICKASFGHILDLKKGLGSIDVNNNFKPEYDIIPSKSKVIKDLKYLVHTCDEIILASDLDREGEAIAWHVASVLKLDKKKTKRIVFNAITKKALNEAVQNPKTIDENLFYSQQARRILDRLVGFKLSPLIWSHTGNNKLSAGRCQSPALSLINDREEIINNHTANIYFKIDGDFCIPDTDIKYSGSFVDEFEDKESCLGILEYCKEGQFIIDNIKKTESKKNPSAPYTTSTLQQDASSKMSMDPKICMSIAQELYEAGLITYMRTDCITISDEAMKEINEYVTKKYGEEYYRKKIYKTSSENAQEAHEAIRPVSIDTPTIDGIWGNQHKRLYSMIWKRTIASQMSPMKQNIHKITTILKHTDDDFNIMSEYDETTFQGFMVLFDHKDNNKFVSELLKYCKKKIEVKYEKIVACQKFTKAIGRYTEASLIKELEKKGIGRPSTYSTIITTIQERGYVKKKSQSGNKKPYSIMTLIDNNITEKEEKANCEAEKNKLFITETGFTVNNYLKSYFTDILSYEFTSRIETDFDLIAQGKKIWYDVVKDVYNGFNPTVERLILENPSKLKERDEERYNFGEYNGKGVNFYDSKYGRTLQIGSGPSANYINVDTIVDLKKRDIRDVQFDELDFLVTLPKHICDYNDNGVYMSYGQYGPFLKYNGKFHSFKSNGNKLLDIKEVLSEMTEERAISIISEVKEVKNKLIKEFKDGTKIMDGQYGPYIRKDKNCVSIGKDTDPTKLSFKDCKVLLQSKYSKK